MISPDMKQSTATRLAAVTILGSEASNCQVKAYVVRDGFTKLCSKARGAIYSGYDSIHHQMKSYTIISWAVWSQYSHTLKGHASEPTVHVFALMELLCKFVRDCTF